MLDCILCVESVLRNQSATEANVRSAVMSILRYAKYRKGGSWTATSQSTSSSRPAALSSRGSTSQDYLS